MAALVILHTGDFHNRLSRAAAEKIAALKREYAGALLLDAGDAVAAGNLTYRIRGEPILRLMGEIGYHAMAMGNRESHPSRAVLIRKLRDAAFPVLAANLVSRRKPLPPKIQPYLIFAGPPRVAVIGLAPQLTRARSIWAKVTDLVYEDPVHVAGQLAGKLKREADLVVCLSHSGLQVDRELAKIAEVDLVLGGHNHRQLVEQQPGQAMVVHPGRYGSHVSCTEIESRSRVRSELVALEEGR